MELNVDEEQVADLEADVQVSQTNVNKDSSAQGGITGGSHVRYTNY